MFLGIAEMLEYMYKSEGKYFEGKQNHWRIGAVYLLFNKISLST